MNLDSISIDNSAISNGLQSKSEKFETEKQNFTLRDSVEEAMKNYFEQLENEQPVNIYELVIAEVEAPLMEAVMNYTKGNQTKASQVLGLNRGTLRKKLKIHGLN